MKENLSDKLAELIEGSTRESTDAEIEKVRRMIHKENSRFRQMKVITVSLWLVSLLVFSIVYQYRHALYYPEDQSSVILFLYVLSHWLPFIAFISTLFLLFRLWGRSRREADLRLIIIEKKLDQLKEASLRRER